MTLAEIIFRFQRTTLKLTRKQTERVEISGAAGGSHLVACLVFPSAVLLCVLITRLRVGIVPRCFPSHQQLFSERMHLILAGNFWCVVFKADAVNI